jgi:hypothetical protein
MSEVYILWAFMIATLVVLAGLMVIFRGWMQAKDALMGDAPASRSHTGHGHH